MSEGLHEDVLTSEQVMYLLGHTAWLDGIGADLYLHYRRLALREGLLKEPPRTTDRIAELIADRAAKPILR